MTETGSMPGPADVPRVTGRRRAVAAWGFVAALAGSALLGFPAGLIWAAVAPRALLQEISQGTAQLVNAESSAFIGADAWFCVIGAAGGVITGLLGYRLLIHGRSWGASAVAATGLIVGAVAAALVALWTGEQIGLATYQHQLATSPNGTLFNASLGLGAKSALAFWPMLTAISIGLTEMVRRPRPSGPDSVPMGYGVPPD
jgi:hypothetical protein